MIQVKFPTLKNSRPFLMTIYLDIFFTEHMKEEIIQTFQGKIFALNKDDPKYEARKEYFENKMDEELDAVESFEKSQNK